MTDNGIAGPLAATGIAVCGASAGIFLAGRRGRFLVPLSGAILVGVTLFGLAPELIRQSGFVAPLLLMAGAYLALTVLDRSGYPVCPSCSHGETYATALLVAAGCHAFVDGWGMTASGAGHAAPMAIGGAILFHKIPEGLALSGLLRGAAMLPRKALLLAAAAETPTLIGGYFGLHSEPGPWTNHLLAIAAGTFLFFGVHAIQGWRSGARYRSEIV